MSDDYGHVRPPAEQHVIIEDETLAQGFTQIPNGVLRRSDIQPGAKLTYMVLLSYAWQEDHAYPGQDRLARDMGVSERSVRTYLNELQSAGLITVKQRGLGKTNLYFVHRLSGPANIAGQSRSANIAGLDRKETTLPEVQDLPPNKTQRKNSEGKSSNNQPSKLVTREERSTIRRFAKDYAVEFRDEAPLESTVGRLVNIYAGSELDLGDFLDLLQDARLRTQKHSASIRKEAGDGSGRKAKMPYFLEIVEDWVERRQGA